jgi:hypothetical protein
MAQVVIYGSHQTISKRFFFRRKLLTRHPLKVKKEFYMTPEEKSLLNEFLGRLGNAGPVQADAEAAMMIAKTAEQQPSALYLTVQRAVWLEQALKHAEERIKALEAEKQHAGVPAAAGNPWLSNTWGSGADNGRIAVPPSGVVSAPASGANQAYMNPPPAYGANPGFMGGGGFMSGGGFMGGGGGSFLANVAATAAGVAVGEMVVDAFSHHSDSRGESDVPSEHHHHQPVVDTDYTPTDDYDRGDSGGFDGGTDI